MKTITCDFCNKKMEGADLREEIYLSHPSHISVRITSVLTKDVCIPCRFKGAVEGLKKELEKLK